MPPSRPTRDSFRWIILALITFSHVIGAAAQYGINTLAPFYQEELGLSRAQVGLFFSAFYLAMTGASFGAGWLADRIGRVCVAMVQDLRALLRLAAGRQEQPSAAILDSRTLPSSPMTNPSRTPSRRMSPVVRSAMTPPLITRTVSPVFGFL